MGGFFFSLEERHCIVGTGGGTELHSGSRYCTVGAEWGGPAVVMGQGIHFEPPVRQFDRFEAPLSNV